MHHIHLPFHIWKMFFYCISNIIPQLPSLKLTNHTWKWMVGIPLFCFVCFGPGPFWKVRFSCRFPGFGYLKRISSLNLMNPESCPPEVSWLPRIKGMVISPSNPMVSWESRNLRFPIQRGCSKQKELELYLYPNCTGTGDSGHLGQTKRTTYMWTIKTSPSKHFTQLELEHR